MKKTPIKFLLLGLFLFFVLDCGDSNKVGNETVSAPPPQTLASEDGKYQITVPGDWLKEEHINVYATIQGSNRKEELFVLVIPQSKEHFTRATGKPAELDLVVDAIRENLTKILTETVFTDPIPITINGLPAKQFEVSGTIDKIKLTYIYGVVDAPLDYYQILTWTLTPRFESNKGTFLEIIHSFKETGINDNPAPTPLPPLKTPAKRK